MRTSTAVMETERGGFSVRAVAIGAAVGSVAAVSNVYVSLKTGWCLPVMSTAAVVGLAVARGQGRSLGAREAAVLSSLASAAGYMAGGGNVAALPAFVMLGGSAPSPVAMAAWFAGIALLGTFIAPLLGRGVVDDLPFPTATATARIVQTLHREGDHTRAREVRSLWSAAIVSGSFALVRALARLPSTLPFPGRAGVYTLGLDTSLLLVGAGGLMTVRTALSTLLGSLLTYGIAAPWLVARGAIAEPSYREIVRFMIWPAASLLVTCAIVQLALDLPRILRRRRERGGATNVSADLVAPCLLGAFVVLLEWLLFGISLGRAVLSIPVAAAMAYVAGRSMGETDVVPTKALAPLAQLAFSGPSPAMVAPAMAPNVTSGVALHAADTLGSLKLSTILGTPPRESLWARAVGCIVGSAVAVMAYRAVVPDALALPTSELPAPAVLVWKSVLELVASGTMPATTRCAIAVGAALGIALALLERRLPARVPSGMGLATGMVLPGSSGLAIALGGLLRALLDRRRAAASATASSCGIVAGESLVALLLQVLASL